ncbi:preprotein translocase subunit SecE [Candidatus Berkiella aquae]|uniref:Protein translocase subunit SecE n=1 Tax=Candidatus Berkiella aquae TaxID=295108 RepID=A0A0Q9YPT9_9GAMM|nr:preprotein translocase subunit SecE [Candidatus Berkiella aquae]MCS5710252.1 preprotein translocase subunit SecE [Candidatus Berkiella aquae]
MNQQSASLGGIMNSFKWTIVLSLIALGILGNYHFADQSLMLRVAGLCITAVLALFIALQTEKGKRFWRFALDARNELRKVVWPSRQETVQTTVMVLGVVAIIGLILWGVDIILLRAIAWLTGYGAS